MSKFKTGDVCRIRQWDEMLQEFGTNSLGGIKVAFGFFEDMKYMCGKKFTIRYVDDAGYYRSEEGIEKRYGVYYAISTGMLEYFTPEREMIAASRRELRNLYK